MGDSSIKLFYGNRKGRAEIIRLVLAATGKQYEDIRFGMDEWPKHKPESPFGQMPFMEIDGKRYAQSIALANYFAREGGLYGKTNLDALKIDQAVQLIQELFSLAGKVYFEKDEAKKAELKQAFKETETPKIFGHCERLLKESGTGYLVGDQLTLADIALFDAASGSLSTWSCSMDVFPLIQALIENVGQNEKIKKYVAERPVTEM